MADLANEVYTILLVLDIVTDVHLGVVPLGEPVKDVGYEFEVRVSEVLHRNIAMITKCPHDFAEVSQISVRHFEFVLKFLNN